MFDLFFSTCYRETIPGPRKIPLIVLFLFVCFGFLKKGVGDPGLFKPELAENQSGD